MKDLIKEVALEVSLKVGQQYPPRLKGEYAVVEFATAFLAELSKRAGAVAYLSRDVENGDCALDSANSPATKYWTESFPVFTFPPIPNDSTALNELIAERTASLTAEVERLRLFDNLAKEYGLSVFADIAELTVQRDAAMKDAERYRWLRSEHSIIYPVAAVVWKRNYDRKESEWVNTSDVHSLDRAIDAEIVNCNNKEK